MYSNTDTNSDSCSNDDSDAAQAFLSRERDSFSLQFEHVVSDKVAQYSTVQYSTVYYGIL